MKKGKTLKANSIKEKLLMILLEKVKINGECIEFTGALIQGKYGTIFWDNTLYRLHRVMFCIRNNIPLTTTADIHHICENKKCFRSDHLIDLNQAKHRQLHFTVTHCIHGHKYTSENTFIKLDGTRRCLICYKKTMQEGINKRRENANRIETR